MVENVSSKVPRVVVVTRPTIYQQLIERHGTRGQVAFFLESRGQELEPLEERHQTVRQAVDRVLKSIPIAWRRALVDRKDLDRFLFEPDDLIVAVGQDGLVANTAKYLSGQSVIGINPSQDLFDGVLVRHQADDVLELMQETVRDQVALQHRTMVEARTDCGQRLVALNEIFIGHASHQSARYVIRHIGREERHSSSGLIVASGTGATGWARSICRNRQDTAPLPEPEEPWLAFLVREAFPSVATGTDVTDGPISLEENLYVRSEMNQRGVIFGDGIEEDRIAFHFGMEVTVKPASTPLRLVLG